MLAAQLHRVCQYVPPPLAYPLLPQTHLLLLQHPLLHHEQQLAVVHARPPPRLDVRLRKPEAWAQCVLVSMCQFEWAIGCMKQSSVPAGSLVEKPFTSRHNTAAFPQLKSSTTGSSATASCPPVPCQAGRNAPPAGSCARRCPPPPLQPGWGAGLFQWFLQLGWRHG